MADELDAALTVGAARPQQEPLLIALAESLKLQSHYAELLNQYDGGQRLVFSSVDAWLARLRTIGTVGAEPPQQEPTTDAIWKLLNEADDHLRAWSSYAWEQWFVQLVDAVSGFDNQSIRAQESRDGHANGQDLQ